MLFGDVNDKILLAPYLQSKGQNHLYFLPVSALTTGAGPVNAPPVSAGQRLKSGFHHEGCANLLRINVPVMIGVKLICGIWVLTGFVFVVLMRFS